MSENDRESEQTSESTVRRWRRVVDCERTFWVLPRRKSHAVKFPQDDWFGQDRNMFGISLSGGGIRSATISLGFLEVFKNFNLLQKSDYVSSVSGGGYPAAYIHAKLCHSDKPDPFDAVFNKDDLDHIRHHRKYLTPEDSFLNQFWSGLRLTVAFVVSTLMNAIWIASLVGVVWFGACLAIRILPQGPIYTIALTAFAVGAGASLLWHFFLHPIRHRRVWSSEVLYSVEAVLLFILVIGAVGAWFEPRLAGTERSDAFGLLAALFVLAVTGFFADPNVLTMHRYYRDRIAEAFLRTADRDSSRMRLHELTGEEVRDAPYPLVNTCLNLRNKDRDAVRGERGSDYFLLSPLVLWVWAQ